jgi:D-alanyl-lipoteichoic acid acyltransferase DltB (MBOAT superfamily)
MSFVQIEFLAFFAAVWLVYWSLPRRAQNALLVASGAVFYGWVHPWFLTLIGFSALLDFWFGRQIAADPERGRRFVWLSVAGNLGMLGTFKYLGWFLDNVDAVLSVVGLGGMPTLQLLLPVGISFYTFQTLSYTIDVHRGRVEARDDLLDYLVFVSFFPQLVAGPIERAGDLLPQVETDRVLRWEDQRDGLSLALWGAFKKVALADAIAPWVDRIYAHPSPSSAMIWAATLGFSVQLLSDFSGYTDIARGTGRMLGFRLRENFRWPFMAATPMEAWSRYHMSFTSWLTDYVYYPLASSAWVRRIALPGQVVGGRGLLARVTVLTFLLSGLWHGAAWHFVAWGVYLGLLQLVYAAIQRRLPASMTDDARWRWVTVPVMFGWQLLALMLFRTPSLATVGSYLTLVPWQSTPEQTVVATAMLGITLVCAAPLVAMMLAEWYLIPRVQQARWYLPVQTTGWALAAWSVWFMARPTVTDFVYFQF